MLGQPSTCRGSGWPACAPPSRLPPSWELPLALESRGYIAAPGWGGRPCPLDLHLGGRVALSSGPGVGVSLSLSGWVGGPPCCLGQRLACGTFSAQGLPPHPERHSVGTGPAAAMKGVLRVLPRPLGCRCGLLRP